MRCSKCGVMKLVVNFHKDRQSKNGLSTSCKVSRKTVYYLNQNRLIIHQRIYSEQNIEKRDIYLENRRKIDFNLRLIVNTQNRIQNSLKSIKSSSTKDILGINIDTYRKWFENQKTPEMNWRNIDVNLRLIGNTRNRIHNSLKSLKSSSTKIY